MIKYDILLHIIFYRVRKMIYNFCEWLIIFYIYCFLGWCFESSYVSLCERRLVNRGFMKGPLLPIYGFGAVIMCLAARPCSNAFQVYFAGMVSATILEFFTGVFMEKLFKIRYWDYSKKRFNFKGHICLSSSIAWGFFAVLLSEVIHPPIWRLAGGIPRAALPFLAAAVTIPALADFITSFKTALNIRDWHVKLEEYKKTARAELHAALEVAGARFEEGEHSGLEGILRALEQISEQAKCRRSEENVIQEISKRRERVDALRQKLSDFATRDKIHMLKRNPTPHNIKLSERFELLLKDRKNK